jgi:transcriptional regulator with XRE-family HTH domain
MSRSRVPLSGDLPPEKAALAGYLRELVDSLDLTDADVARRLNVDAGTLSRYLSGRTVPFRQWISSLQAMVASMRGLTDHERDMGLALWQAAAARHRGSDVLEEDLQALKEHLEQELAWSRQRITQLTEELARAQQRYREAKAAQAAAQTDGRADERQLRPLQEQIDEANGRIRDLRDQLRDLELTAKLQDRNLVQVNVMQQQAVTVRQEQVLPPDPFRPRRARPVAWILVAAVVAIVAFMAGKGNSGQPSSSPPPTPLASSSSPSPSPSTSLSPSPSPVPDPSLAVASCASVKPELNSPWSTSNANMVFSVAKTCRAMAEQNSIPTPVIIVTAFIKILNPPFGGVGYTFRDESTGNPLQQDGDLSWKNDDPKTGYTGHLVFVIWDESPQATRISITISGNSWSDANVHNFPVPTSG